MRHADAALAPLNQEEEQEQQLQDQQQQEQLELQREMDECKVDDDATGDTCEEEKAGEEAAPRRASLEKKDSDEWESGPGVAAADADDSLVALHAIDLTRSDDARITEELMQQMQTVGFLTLTNVPDYDEPRYLAACKALHALPAAEKRQMYLRKDEPSNPNIYRGFQPFKSNDASHKEFFDQGFPPELLPPQEAQLPLYEATPLPRGDQHAWIGREFERTRAAWYAVAMRVIRLLARGLGKPEAFFDPWFVDGSLTTMRTIHYQPRAAGLVDSSQLGADDLRLTTPAHADSGFLTFLATFGYPGLQVFMHGAYRSVAPARDTLVVNLGDLFARISNYRLKATFHRVLDTGAERFSSPMFMEPKYSAQIPRGLLESARQSVDEDMPEDAPCFGDWMVRRMMASYVEWQGFEVPASRREFVDAVELTDFSNRTPSARTSTF